MPRDVFTCIELTRPKRFAISGARYASKHCRNCCVGCSKGRALVIILYRYTHIGDGVMPRDVFTCIGLTRPKRFAISGARYASIHCRNCCLGCFKGAGVGYYIGDGVMSRDVFTCIGLTRPKRFAISGARYASKHCRNFCVGCFKGAGVGYYNTHTHTHTHIRGAESCIWMCLHVFRSSSPTPFCNLGRKMNAAKALSEFLRGVNEGRASDRDLLFYI